MGTTKNPVRELLAAGEEKFDDMINELVTNPRFAEALGRTIQRGVGAKKTLDRRMRVALNLVNLPSRADYDDLTRRVVDLGRTIARLETRIDAITARMTALADKTAQAKKKK